MFRSDFVNNGPLLQGLAPIDAVDRLSRFKEELKTRERKYELCKGGEEIFKLASQLFDLYVEVTRTINEWKLMLWNSVASKVNEMSELMVQVTVEV